jgi:hypothetical protein
VRIVKNLTNIVFGNLPDPEDVDLYAEVYNDLKNDGELKDNAKWAEALRDMYEVRSVYVLLTLSARYQHVLCRPRTRVLHVNCTCTSHRAHV